MVRRWRDMKRYRNWKVHEKINSGDLVSFNFSLLFRLFLCPDCSKILVSILWLLRSPFLDV